MANPLLPRSSFPFLRLLWVALLMQLPALAPAAYTLVWADEFTQADGSAPNPANWNYDIGGGGWGNGEEQYYTNSTDNSRIENNQLVIELRPDTANDYPGNDYTSARLLTKGKHDWTYGKFEARIRLPFGGNGLWPAFWMLGADIDSVEWPNCGEIDIMEYVSRVPNEVFGTIHGPGYFGGGSYGNTYDYGQPIAPPQNIADPYANDPTYYHVYAVEWDPTEIRWYIDGTLYHTAVPANIAPNTWVFDHDHFILLNLAIGGNFGGAIDVDNLTFPAQMLVDYVRVYDGTPPPPPATPVPALIQAEDYTAQSGVQLETTTDTGGGQNVGFLTDGDWMEYFIKTPTAGKYAIDMRTASFVGGLARVVLSANANSVTSGYMPGTGGWQNWTTVTAGEIDLPTGDVTLRVTIDSPVQEDLNINWLDIRLVKADPNADPDGDGFINLFEEGLVLNMFTADPATLWPTGNPVESGGQNYLHLSYRRRTGGSGTTGVSYVADGYNYTVEVSSTMASGSWQSGASEVQAVGLPSDNGDGSESVTVRALSPISGSGKFIRLDITESP